MKYIITLFVEANESTDMGGALEVTCERLENFSPDIRVIDSDYEEHTEYTNEE